MALPNTTRTRNELFIAFGGQPCCSSKPPQHSYTNSYDNTLYFSVLCSAVAFLYSNLQMKEDWYQFVCQSDEQLCYFDLGLTFHFPPGLVLLDASLQKCLPLHPEAFAVLHWVLHLQSMEWRTIFI